MQTIAYHDLPEDMQVLLVQFVELAGGEKMRRRLERQRFVLREIPVGRLPKPIRFCDYRDAKYALAMSSAELPPVVVSGTTLLDGYHRVWLARRQRRCSIQAIDLDDVGYGPALMRQRHCCSHGG